MLFWRDTCYNNLSQCRQWRKCHQKWKHSRFSVRRVHCHTQASTLRWRHNDHAGVSNHQPHGCLLNRLFRRKSKKTSKLRVTGLCMGNSPGTGEFPAQMASYAENVSIWWRHHVDDWVMLMSFIFFGTSGRKFYLSIITYTTGRMWLDWVFYGHFETLSHKLCKSYSSYKTAHLSALRI